MSSFDWPVAAGYDCGSRAAEGGAAVSVAGHSRDRVATFRSRSQDPLRAAPTRTIRWRCSYRSLAAGTTLTGLILDEDRTITLEALQDIPIGHKIALKDMAVGDTVIKYGVDIGKVVAPIKRGQHAHVHNIKTKRW